MVEPRFRTEPLRSRSLLDSARGQACTLNFVGVCSHDTETTISAHIHDEQFGRAQKADDTSTVHSCHRCHMWLDWGWVGKMEWAVVQFHIIRALQRTLRNRVERGILKVKLDEAKPLIGAHPKARKPKAARAKIPTRKTEWPSRSLQSANNLRKVAP